MVDLAFTLTDVGVLVILIVSSLLAFARGFIKESLSVVGWIGAIFAVLYSFPIFQPFMRKVIPVALLADAITGIAVFLGALVLISIVSYAIARRVRDSSLNAIDRSLGFIFGLARGAIVISVSYLILLQLVPASEHPFWILDSQSLPAIQASADLLAKLVPEKGLGFGSNLNLSTQLPPE